MAEINYTLNLDTSRVATAMSEVRSQMNTAFTGAGLGGFVDTGRAAYSGVVDFGGAAAAGGAAIASGLASVPRLGFSYMPEAMSMVPHYGIVNAQASLQAEWMSRFYGPAGAVPFAPPGVGAVEYHNYLLKEHERKFSEAGTEAAISAGTAIAGFAGATAGWMGGAALGRGIGAAALSWLPGGAVIGGLAGGFIGSEIGERVVGAGARVFNDERHLTREMGAIVDARRNLPLDLQARLGAAATAGARDIGMDPNQMGDILAAASQLGTMPKTLDPEALRAQARDLGQSIRDIASELHVSMGQAQRMMRTLERFGFHGAEGADWLVGQAARIGAGMSPAGVFGLAVGGASTAMQAQIGGGFGFHMFPDLAAAATHSGLNREQLQMAGGVGGLTQAYAGLVLGNAFGPMGTLQMAAAPGRGFDVPRGLEATITGGIASLASAPGGFARNFLAMQTHRGALIRQMGPDRITEMGFADLRNMGELLARTGLVENAYEGSMFMAEQRGMNENQAAGAAFQAVNARAQHASGAITSRIVQELREERARNHEAYAHADEVRFGQFGIVGRAARAARDTLRGWGGATAISTAAAVETETRAAFHRAGVPYNVEHPGWTTDVALSGDAGAQGAINAALGITGADRRHPADVARRTYDLSVALSMGSRIRITKRAGEQMAKKDSGDIRRRLKEFEEGLTGDPKATRERMLGIVQGTDLEKQVRAGRVGGAVALIHNMAEAAGIHDRMGMIDDPGIFATKKERAAQRDAAIHKDPIHAAIERTVEENKAGGKKGGRTGEAGRVDLAGDPGDALGALLNKLVKHMDDTNAELRRISGHRSRPAQ